MGKGNRSDSEVQSADANLFAHEGVGNFRRRRVEIEYSNAAIVFNMLSEVKVGPGQISRRSGRRNRRQPSAGLLFISDYGDSDGLGWIEAREPFTNALAGRPAGKFE